MMTFIVELATEVSVLSERLNTVERLLDAAEQTGASAVLASIIVTHADVHMKHMRRLHALAQQRGLRRRLVLIVGGTRITDKLARECGLDAGFGRGAGGRQVASFIVDRLSGQRRQASCE